jgi:hypothetical protein
MYAYIYIYIYIYMYIYVYIYMHTYICIYIDFARKGVSPAFSKSNLDKKLPKLRQKIAQFTDILDQHIDCNVSNTTLL